MFFYRSALLSKQKEENSGSASQQKYFSAPAWTYGSYFHNPLLRGPSVFHKPHVFLPPVILWKERHAVRSVRKYSPLQYQDGLSAFHPKRNETARKISPARVFLWAECRIAQPTQLRDGVKPFPHDAYRYVRSLQLQILFCSFNFFNLSFSQFI